MYDYFIFVSFLLVLIMIFWEIKLYSVTPFVVLAIPYLVSIGGSIILDKLKFLETPLLLEGLFPNFLFLYVFFLGDAVLKFYKFEIKMKAKLSNITLDLIYFSAIVAAGTLLCYILAKYNYLKLSSNLRKLQFGHGIIGHISNFALATLPYLVWIDINKLKSKLILRIAIGIILFYKLIIGTKYVLLIGILSVLFSYIYFKDYKLKFRKVFSVFFIATSAFFAVYAFHFWIQGRLSKAFLEFIIRHFSNYMFSPAYDSAIIFAYAPKICSNVLLPNFHNIFCFLIGCPYKTGISEHFFEFINGEYSNVWGLFATIFCRTESYFLTFLVVLCISFFSCMLHEIARYTSCLHIKVLDILNLAILSISYFGFWYGTFNVLEIMFFIIIFNLVDLTTKIQRVKL